MLATHTGRTCPYSVHMTSAEAADVLDQCANAVTIAAERDVDLPAVNAIATKLSALLRDKDKKRA